MASYQYLSSIYDRFMADYDYDGVIGRFTPYLVDTSARSVLDLACGTGTASLALDRMGYAVTGIDLSEEMLTQAREKALEAHAKIRFLQADIRDFSVRSRYDAALSLTDGFNYLLEESDLGAAFTNIAAHLNPGGLLMFDMSTAYKFEHLIGDATFAESDEDAAYIWENFWDPVAGILTFDLNIFEQERSGLYRRHYESHSQRAYGPDVVSGLLEQSGFDLISVTGTQKNLEISDRLFYIAKRKK